MISLLLPLRGTDESRRNCKGEKPTARTTQRSRAPTKGLCSPTSNRPPPPAPRWAGFGAGLTPRGAAARHAVPRSTATLSDSSRVRVSLAPSLVEPGSEAVAPRPDRCRPLLACCFAAEAGHRHNQLHGRTSDSLVHPHKARWPPTAVVARGTGREHRLSSVKVPDQPPGLAPEVLVERMRMPNLRRDGLATPRAAGA